MTWVVIIVARKNIEWELLLRLRLESVLAAQVLLEHPPSLQEPGAAEVAVSC